MPQNGFSNGSFLFWRTIREPGILLWSGIYNSAPPGTLWLGPNDNQLHLQPRLGMFCEPSSPAKLGHTFLGGWGAPSAARKGQRILWWVLDLGGPGT